MISQTELKKILQYDKNTGNFIWKTQKGKRIKAGDIAGNIRKDGYVHIQINNKKYKAHRLAWLFVYGEYPKNEIDHKNKNKSDNRIDNLRDIEHKQNMKNLPKYKNNASSVIGVAWDKKIKMWKAYISINKVKKHLGYFISFSDAVDARKNAEVIYGF